MRLQVWENKILWQIGHFKTFSLQPINDVDLIIDPCKFGSSHSITTSLLAKVSNLGIIEYHSEERVALMNLEEQSKYLGCWWIKVYIGLKTLICAKTFVCPLKTTWGPWVRQCHVGRQLHNLTPGKLLLQVWGITPPELSLPICGLVILVSRFRK